MLIVATIFVITYIGFSFGGFPYLRVDRAGVAIIGAVALVSAGILTFDESIKAIDFNTIILLLGMMMVAANLRISGFFAVVSRFVKQKFYHPLIFLAAIVLVSGILSAIYVNDTICIFFTPFIIEMTYALSLNPVPYLIALATASNIGSVATITGNPQNMLIGIFSGIPFLKFASKLAPIALVCLIIDYFVIYLIYRKKLSVVHPHKNFRTGNIVYKPLLYKTLSVTLLMLFCFFAGYNISLVAIAAASVLLITRRIKSDKIYNYINWNLLMMFSGLFIIIHAVEKIGLSGLFLQWALKFNLDNKAVFSVVTAIISNLVSNVPAVILFKPIVNHFPSPEKFWFLLAMASTFAGNLTIIGSVANLIVVEQAKDYVKISFFEYLKVGMPVTVLTVLVGFLLL